MKKGGRVTHHCHHGIVLSGHDEALLYDDQPTKQIPNETANNEGRCQTGQTHSSNADQNGYTDERGNNGKFIDELFSGKKCAAGSAEKGSDGHGNGKRSSSQSPDANPTASTVAPPTSRLGPEANGSFSPAATQSPEANPTANLTEPLAPSLNPSTVCVYDDICDWNEKHADAASKN